MGKELYRMNLVNESKQIAIGIALAKELRDLEEKRDIITIKLQDGRMTHEWASLVLQQTFIDGKIDGIKEAYKIIKRL